MNKGNKTQNKTKQKNSVGLKKELAGFFFFSEHGFGEGYLLVRNSCVIYSEWKDPREQIGKLSPLVFHIIWYSVALTLFLCIVNG
jgi:hypothetical protein